MLLSVVFHDGSVETLHIGLGLIAMGVDNLLVKGAGRLHDGTLWTGWARVVLLELSQPRPGREGRRGHAGGFESRPGGFVLEFQLQFSWRLECSASHSSADGEEQDAPDKYCKDVAADDATNLVGQNTLVSGCESGARRAVFRRRGRGVAIVVYKVDGAGRNTRCNKEEQHEGSLAHGFGTIKEIYT